MPRRVGKGDRITDLPKTSLIVPILFNDANARDQVAVIELGKDIVRATLPIVETRSGKNVEYQDDEARKSASK